MATTTPAPQKPRAKRTPEDVLYVLLPIARERDGILESSLMRKTCVNVFDEKWRINLWVSANNPVVPNAGRIVKSYFVKFGESGLEILED
jgi:hypothetical protein